MELVKLLTNPRVSSICGELKEPYMRYNAKPRIKTGAIVGENESTRPKLNITAPARV